MKSMIKCVTEALALVSVLLVPAQSSLATPTLLLRDNYVETEVGSNFRIDFGASGLGSLGEPSIMEYQLTLLYDPLFVEVINVEYLLGDSGNYLGGPYSTDFDDDFDPGAFTFGESLWPIYGNEVFQIADEQLPEIDIASIEFTALQQGVTSILVGDIQVHTGNGFPSDKCQISIVNCFRFSSDEVDVSIEGDSVDAPEPSGLLLLGTGLAGLVGYARRRR